MERTEKCENHRKTDPTDDEKPVKKARYLWEVKGKRHLKNSSSGPSCSLGEASTSQERAQSPHEREEAPNTCCLESFLSKTEDIIDRDSSEDESQKFLQENDVDNETPVTLVSAQPKNQDYYLIKWQARQIARGFVDNTINSMLENWVDRPLDAANFVEDCENDGQVEDDAILMAIQSHGLQSGFRGGLIVGNSFSNSNLSLNSTMGVAGSSGRESRAETIGSSNISESTYDNFENLHKEQENESSVASSSSSMSVDTVSSSSNHFEGDIGDPMDFLNAAVSVAIQKKGLTYG